MSDQDFTLPSPHELARRRIATWRGECLDIFSRGEHKIAQTLEALRTKPAHQPQIKIRHLAGQRSEDVSTFLKSLARSDLQEIILASLEKWRTEEKLRLALAHGVVRYGLDANENWCAVFCTTTYKSNQPSVNRTAIFEQEADDIRMRLRARFKELSANLTKLTNMVAD